MDRRRNTALFQGAWLADMWCANCRKNVSGTLSLEGQSICCARCGSALPDGFMASESSEQYDQHILATQATTLPCPESAAQGCEGLSSGHGGHCEALPCPAELATSSAPECDQAKTSAVAEEALQPARENLPARPASRRFEREPFSALESWELDEDLRHMQRLLRATGPLKDLERASLRFDAASPLPGSGGWPDGSRRSRPRGNGIARGLLFGLSRMLGAAALVCGLLLLSWSWLAARGDLCMQGLIATALGQCGLLLSMALRPLEKESSPEPPGPNAWAHSLLLANLEDLDKTARVDEPVSR